MAQSRRPSLPSAAWALLASDPVSLMSWTAGLALLDLAWLVAALQTGHFPTWRHPGFTLLLSVGYVLLAAPLRTGLLRRGAQLLGAAPRGGWTVVLGVELVRALLRATLTWVPTGIGAAAGWVAWSDDRWAAGSTALLLGVLVGVTGGWLVDLLTSTAAAHAVRRGYGAPRALLASWRGLRRAPGSRLLVVALGHALSTLGALLGGAGALPGYAWTEMALLELSRREEQEGESDGLAGLGVADRERGPGRTDQR